MSAATPPAPPDPATVARDRALALAVLTGTPPIDATAQLEIDAALADGAGEPILHAAALWAAYSTDGDLRLSRSTSRLWVLGMHELIDSGHLDAVSYALPRLRSAFPGLPFLDNMAMVFRRLPEPLTGDERDPFADDHEADVQVVRRRGADTVVLAFCGGRNQLGLALNLLDRWFARLNTHIVYLRDRERVGYIHGVPALGADMDDTIDGLRKLVSNLDAQHVVAVGNSAGAAGAIRYARSLGIERVLALSPISGGPEYTKKTLPHLPRGGVRWWGDLVPLCRGGGGVRTHVLYGADNEGDRQQAVRLNGLPGVTIDAVPDWSSHHLIGGLLRAGWLERVLRWLEVGDDGVNLSRLPGSTMPR